MYQCAKIDKTVKMILVLRNRYQNLTKVLNPPIKNHHVCKADCFTAFIH